MTPRTAGILGMLGAAVAIVACCFLIVTPPLSIVGALGFVASAIAFAVAASLTVRKSWGGSSWPEVKVRPPVVEGQPIPRHIASYLCGGGVAFAAVGAWRLVMGDTEGWARIIIGLVFAAVGFLVLIWLIKKERSK
jgi:ABC-type Fe3+-siderophore transport system permease subunit